MKVLIFQHTPEESPGTLLDWTKARGLEATVHHWYREENAPDIQAFDLLVVLGGPMNVDQLQDYSWLAKEKVFLRDWLAFQRPALGLCLGGQLLAQTLGGTVTKAGMREVGFHEVTRIEGASAPALKHWPQNLSVYQYHEDAFSLPPGCTSLLTSTACEHQAFSRGRKVLGLQFHPESTAEWIEGNGPSIVKAPDESFVQTPGETAALLPEKLPPMTESFFNLLDDFLEGFSG